MIREFELLNYFEFQGNAEEGKGKNYSRLSLVVSFNK